MVVSVSLSGVSVSYSGIDGAGQRTEREWSSAQVPSPPHGGEILDHPGCVAFIHSFIPLKAPQDTQDDWKEGVWGSLDESHMASQDFSKEGPDLQPG